MYVVLKNSLRNVILKIPTHQNTQFIYIAMKVRIKLNIKNVFLEVWNASMCLHCILCIALNLDYSYIYFDIFEIHNINPVFIIYPYRC